MYILADLLDALTGKKSDAARMLISDGVSHSRQVTPSSLFIALPGVRVDGHDHLSLCIQVKNSLSALQQTAAQWCRQLAVHVFGLTGSVEKSSTKESAADVLSNHCFVIKNTANNNIETGLPLAFLRMTRAALIAVFAMDLCFTDESDVYIKGSCGMRMDWIVTEIEATI